MRTLTNFNISVAVTEAFMQAADVVVIGGGKSGLPLILGGN